MEYELEPVYAIKGEDGMLWNAETNSWDDSLCDDVLFTDEDDAQAELDKYYNFPNAYVVEIGETGSKEQGDPVVVSEEEAEMLEQAKSQEEYPAEIIHRYVYDSHNFSEWDYDSEIRLMRAYVNGWKEKPEELKKYVVFVPGTNQLYDYHKFAPGSIFPTAYISSKVPASELFTQEEIDVAGLSDCEKKAVKDNGNEHN